jgi:hypothetical protein
VGISKTVFPLTDDEQGSIFRFNIRISLFHQQPAFCPSGWFFERSIWKVSIQSFRRNSIPSELVTFYGRGSLWYYQGMERGT